MGRILSYLLGRKLSQSCRQQTIAKKTRQTVQIDFRNKKWRSLKDRASLGRLHAFKDQAESPAMTQSQACGRQLCGRVCQSRLDKVEPRRASTSQLLKASTATRVSIFGGKLGKFPNNS